MATPTQNTDKSFNTGRKAQDTRVGSRTDSDKQNMDSRINQTDVERTSDSRRASTPSTSDDVSSRSLGSDIDSRDEVRSSQKANSADWQKTGDWNRTEDSEGLNVYGQDHNLDQDDDHQSDTRNPDDSLRKPVPEKFPGSAQDPKKLSADAETNKDLTSSRSARSSSASDKDATQH